MAGGPPVALLWCAALACLATGPAALQHTSSYDRGEGAAGEKLEMSVAFPSATRPQRQGRKPVVWAHVHKSAGTMMCRLATLVASERAPNAGFGCDQLSMDDYHLRGASSLWSGGTSGRRQWTTCAERKQWFARTKYTWNAIERELSDGDLCYDDFVYGVLLDHPLKRMQSMARHWELFVDQIRLSLESKQAHPPEPVDYVISCIQNRNCHPGTEWENFDNYGVRMFGGYEAMSRPPGGVDEANLEAALAVLRRFHLVVPLANLTSARAQAMMDSTIGWHVVPTNRTIKYNFPHPPLTAQQRESLRRLNALDIRLYEEMTAPWL